MRGYLASLLVGLMLAVPFVPMTGCVRGPDGTTQPVNILGPIPSEVYLNQIQPFVDSLYILYGDSLDEDEKALFVEITDNLREQAMNGDEVSILPAIVIVGREILADKFEEDSLSREEAILAIVGLNLLNNMFPESPVLQAIYPVLLDLLNGVIDGVHPASLPAAA